MAQNCKNWFFGQKLNKHILRFGSSSQKIGILGEWKWWNMIGRGFPSKNFTVPKFRILAGPVSLLDKNQFAGQKIKCFGGKNQVLSEIIQKGSNGPKMIPNVNKDEKAIDIQRWTSTVPHSHGVSPKSYGDRGIGDHNYCRCPDYIFAPKQ